MRIVNFGSCNLDYVYTLDHIVKTGETEHSRHMEVFPGGKGLNQSIAISRAGAKVYHAGCLGTDGELLLSTLRDSGVDLSFIRITEEKSGHAIIQVSEKGENSIFIHSGANFMFTREYIDSVLERFEAGDILLLQNETNNIGYIIEKAYQKGLVILFNPSPIDGVAENVDLRKISYMILNEIEGEYLSGCKEPVKMLSTLRKNYPNLKIVLTLGQKGCMYHDHKHLLYHPSYEVQVVDSTAAGDAFMGYFAASLSENLSPAVSIERACAAAALVVSRKGAAPSIPSAKEVEAALKTLKTRGIDKRKGPEQVSEQTKEYILADLKHPALSGLAGELGYSAAYAGQMVKRTVGKSFSALVQELRCSVAAGLLWETNLSVSDIIEQIGYSNESFFRRKFEELYGMSPSAYRKMGDGRKK